MLEVDDERLHELYMRFEEMVLDVQRWNMDSPDHDTSLTTSQVVSLMLSAYRMAEEDGQKG
jgi:hypothetical protein